MIHCRLRFFKSILRTSYYFKKLKTSVKLLTPTLYVQKWNNVKEDSGYHMRNLNVLRNIALFCFDIWSISYLFILYQYQFNLWLLMMYRITLLILSLVCVAKICSGKDKVISGFHLHLLALGSAFLKPAKVFSFISFQNTI